MRSTLRTERSPIYMDSVSRNRMGYEPIMPYLRQVREVQNPGARYAASARSRKRVCKSDGDDKTYCRSM